MRFGEFEYNKQHKRAADWLMNGKKTDWEQNNMFMFVEKSREEFDHWFFKSRIQGPN